MEKIDNIRKADIIYDYLKINKFEDVKENINKVINLESSAIEKEIKNKKLPTGQNEMGIFIKKNSKKIIIEIFKKLEDSQITEIESYINNLLNKDSQ